MNCKVGLIGVGNMAGAILHGMQKSSLLTPTQIALYDVNSQAVEPYVQQGFTVCGTISHLVSQCDYIILSVKPQSFSDVLAEMKPVVRPEIVFVSIAAGVSAAQICTGLGYDAKIIRVMPNTPLLIGSGSTALSFAPPATSEECAYVKQIFAAGGAVEEIAPYQMNEVIPLNGSSPAYIYLFAKVFVERAVALGFDADTANRLFCNSLIGSARMMLETGKTHQQLIDMVTSPGGTTFQGLDALYQGGFEQALTNCFDATIRRAYELGS